MKYLLMIFTWFISFIVTVKTLYFFIPATLQYTFAEHLGYYGDESVMDFILYVFTCIAVVISSLMLYLLFRLMKRE